MTRTALLAVGLLASISIGVAPAHADTASPLYRLVDVAAQRLATADAVAAFKWVNGGSIEDPERVAKVLDDVSTQAREHGIDDGYVRRAFEHQIHATEGVEYALFGRWKFDPATAPTAAPDLSESRSAIDGFNRAMVDEMATQWDVLRGPGCARARDAARAEVIDARHLDPLYVQALDAATASYC